MRVATIKTGRSFKRIYKQGKTSADNFFVIKTVFDNTRDSSDVAISVSRKVGKAVVRNKIRRRVIEIWREMLATGSLQPGYDVLFIARQKAANADFFEIKRSVIKLLSRRKILR